jgi:hypothetical protein
MLQLTLLAVLVGVVMLHLLRGILAHGAADRIQEGFVDSYQNPIGANAGEPTGEEPSPAVTNTNVPTTPATDYPSAYELEEQDDPLDLPWLASLSPADRAARRGQLCAPRGREAGPAGTTILTVSKSCEDGLPHTRAGNRILIPDSIPPPLRQETLEHEMIHIWQRRFPQAWIDFYRRNWSFEFHDAPPSDMPTDLIQARRSNPDTWDPDTGGPWACWMGRYWPVPVYRDPQQPRLRDAITVWWDTWKRTILTAPPIAWSAFFGTPAQDEHPHEIAAVKLVAGDRATEAGRRLAAWWETQGRILRAENSSA